MLTNITVKGFKSIHELTDLKLGCVNVLIGANGCGKSNLLEAIGLVSAAISGRVDNELLNRRGVRLSPPELYKTNLQSKQPGKNIEFVVEGIWDKSLVKYEASLMNPIRAGKWEYKAEKLLLDGRLLGEMPEVRQVAISDNSADASFPFPGEGLISLMLLEGAAKSLREYLYEYAIFSPTTPVLRGIQQDISGRDPVGLLGGRLAEAIEDVLDLSQHTLGSVQIDEILDLLDWVDEFDITSPSPELLSPDVPSLRKIVEFKDRWMGKKGNRISGYDASEGALYVLFTLVLALHPRIPHFFAIDNFGQVLNPRLERALTRQFCQLILESQPQRQVLLTTHNPLALDGLDLRDDRIRLFTVERNRSTGGATTVSRVTLSKKVLEKAKNGTPLSQMWVMGLLGGVPDIL